MILIALGGNLHSRAGTPAQTLNAALAQLRRDRVRILAVSPFYATPAWPDPADPAFVNAVACLETERDPAALMTLLHQTETAFGRLRSTPNAPRTLDLDLLDYDGLVQDGPPHLPHPRLRQRGFVLLPLADVAPHWRHPATGESVQSLIAGLPPESRRLHPDISHL